MTAESSQPYVSLVVTTRNDDHGGDPLKRLQALVNSFDAQCRRTGLDAELIVVEWNPPQDRPRVASLVRIPEPAFCTYRFIEVPPALHQRLQYADVLPLFQMIAKNVGIRRARGEFVLTTNIDIIFSNELVEYLAVRRLKPGHLYRVDRHDIEPNVPIDAPLDAQMTYCASHQLRVHTRWGSYPVNPLGEKVTVADDIVDGRTVMLGSGWHVRESARPGTTFRWASDRVELIVSRSDVQPAAGVALEVEIDANPYLTGSSIQLAAVEGERVLMKTEVGGRVCIEIPLPDAQAEPVQRIQLVVEEGSGGTRLDLPAFELREPMRYRVHSAQIKEVVPARPSRFDYPSHYWTNANDRSNLALSATREGLLVTSDPRRFSYCAQFGPLRAPRRGAYRFELNCTVLEGGLTIGVLSGDRQSWLPASIKQHQDWQNSPARHLEVTIDCLADTSFWLVLANDHPRGDGVSRFFVHDLTGSEPPASLMSAGRGLPTRLRALSRMANLAYARAAPRARRVHAELQRPRLRGRMSRLIEAVSRVIMARLPSGLRYRLVRVTSEFQNVEDALESSDRQLRELAPLRHLMDFNTFLRNSRPDNLHLNACGDFQLMAREHWDELRGYPEFGTFSMNIDGLLSYAADAAGIREITLAMPIYHFEHGVGSGWSPEGEALLRRRIAERGITWLDASTVYIWAAYMKWLGRPMIFNRSDWGFAGSVLAETVHSPVSTGAPR